MSVDMRLSAPTRAESRFFVSDKSEINESNNQKMKTNVKRVGAYEAPKVEVIEVEVEQGFAASFDGDNPPTVENGGNPF